MRVISLAQELIKRPSITPNDAGCQTLMTDILAPLGFVNETMQFADTTNLWARKGLEAPVFCFAGHTDVVPTGPLTEWHHPPFDAVIEDGFLHGRGSADMKGSLAAMLSACERFIADYPNHKGSIAFLITSDEEGPFINGTTKVIDTLEARKEKIDYCIVGEPSSSKLTGDVVKNGRRGSLTGDLLVHGKQGHVAYPHLAVNPIHQLAPALSELSQIQWDEGNEFFPPTSFQVSNINAGTGAGNVIPGSLSMCFNFRYSTETTAQQLTQKVETLLNSYDFLYTLDWTYNGVPFLTEQGALVEATLASIEFCCERSATLSTSGGTSDGRFIAPTGAQVVELGPENESIHQINEKVSCQNLIDLEAIYYDVLRRLLT